MNKEDSFEKSKMIIFTFAFPKMFGNGLQQKLFQSRPKYLFSGTSRWRKLESSRLEEMFLMIFLATERRKRCGIYQKMCDVYGEACFSQKYVYKWAKPGWVCHYEPVSEGCVAMWWLFGEENVSVTVVSKECHAVLWKEKKNLSLLLSLKMCSCDQLLWQNSPYVTIVYIYIYIYTVISYGPKHLLWFNNTYYFLFLRLLLFHLLWILCRTNSDICKYHLLE